MYTHRTYIFNMCSSTNIKCNVTLIEFSYRSKLNNTLNFNYDILIAGIMYSWFWLVKYNWWYSKIDLNQAIRLIT